MRVGFLGEGRKEKGCLLFLKAVRQFTACGEHEIAVCLQVNNPRGFSPIERLELDEELASLRKSPSAQIVHGPMSPTAHHGLMRSLDFVVLPYDPANYCRRVSGMAMLAAVYAKSIITSSGTWTAEALQQKFAAGVTFAYPPSDESRAVRNLRRAIGVAVERRVDLAAEARNRAEHFRSRCTARSYIAALLNGV